MISQSSIRACGAPLASRARKEVARLELGHANLWEDLRVVLLDPDPDPWELEVVRRWIRDEVERDLRWQVKGARGIGMIRWAARLAPHLMWSLPFSRALPPPAYHRRIVAILLPHKCRVVERLLAVQAFRDGLRDGGT